MTQKEVREQLELCEKATPRDLRQLDQTDNIVRVSYPALLKQLDEAMLKLGAWHEESCWCLEIFPGARSLCETGMQIKAYFGETR